MSALERTRWRLRNIARMVNARASIRVWQAAALMVTIVTMLYFALGAAGGK
jgi:hypothetical protein